MKFFLSLGFLLFIVVTPLAAAPLSGKAAIDGEGVSGVTVMAYPVTSLSLNDAATYTAKTSDDGLFSLELPAGEYYLLARGADSYNFYGRNPVAVTEEGLENVNLLMLPENLAAPEDDSEIDTGIAGFVSVDGEPVEGAIVMVYADLSSRLKGLGLGWISPSDENGYFEAPLPVGNYYLVVRVRKGGKLTGPLQAGDLFGYLSGNPLVVKEGTLARVHIPLVEVPDKKDSHAVSLFGSTSISGRVLDASGQPAAGLHVLLYEDPMMLNRPLYVSRQTDVDGRYQLSFPDAGKYYLAARNQLGGTPAPGELYGRYLGSSDHSIRIKAGHTLENVEISVDEVY